MITFNPAVLRLNRDQSMRVARKLGCHSAMRDSMVLNARSYNHMLVRLMADSRLCPHGMVLADNVCGICSEGRPNRISHDTTRADLLEEFDEHALVEGYYDEEPDEPEEDDDAE